MIAAGTICTIAPAYSITSGRCDLYDEWAECECEVIEESLSGDVLVYVKARGPVWIPRTRLRTPRAS